MSYNRVHRFLLRTVASRGVMTISECEQALHSFPSDDPEALEKSLTDLVKEINDEIRPFLQSIKITTDELTNEKVVVFLSLGYDETSKAQNMFNATELEFFRVLIEHIMSTETRQVTAVHAINSVRQLKSSFSKTDAEKILKKWCNMKYLDKEGNNYALGVRAIHEFENYLLQNMPDSIEKCVLCSKIVFRGYNCPGCGKGVHTRCLNQYLEKVQKWPCCKIAYSGAQLEQLNHESSSLLESQATNTEQQTEQQDTELEPTQILEQDTELVSQDIIPEISQRVTRKRKRV